MSLLVENIEGDSNSVSLGGEEDSVGKGACHQAWLPEFNPPQATWQKKRTDSPKLFSDFHVCTLAQVVDKIPSPGETQTTTTTQPRAPSQTEAGFHQRCTLVNP